jgi:hypothetical protein
MTTLPESFAEGSGSVRPKQELSLSAKTEYSAAQNHQIFGFGRIFGTFLFFRPKVGNLLHNQLNIGIINAKFDFFVTKLESC